MNFKQITLKGTATEKGLAHGEEFKEQIKELVEIRTMLVKNFFKDQDFSVVEKICHEQIANLKGYKNLYDEFSNIAKASDASEVELMILNNYTDLRDFSWGTSKDDDGGCSIIAVKNENSTFIGQTWDMHASATPYTIFMDVEENDGSYTKVLSLTGCLGLAGVNASGVGALINNMHCAEVNAKGLPWNALVRLLLQEKSARLAKECLNKNLPCSGHNYLVADKNEIYNIETTGLKTLVNEFIADNELGYSFHTNHYVSELKDFEIMERQSKSTHKRYEALNKYFSNNAYQNITDLRSYEKSFYAEGPADTICIPTPKEPHAPMTCGGVCLDLVKHKGTAFQGVYNDNKHLSFSF